ncbi:MAG: TolC family protein [bacterium]|nr:TolC family protein [bacterium]
MRFYILIIGILSTFPAWGAQPLSLEKAIRTTVERSPEVLAAQRRADAASSRARQAKGHRLPSLDLYETYSRTNNPAEAFALTLNQGRFDMEEFFLSDPNNPDPINTFITRLEVVQPVYTGGKLAARIDQADEMMSAEQYTARHTAEKAAFNTIEAYINLAKAHENLGLVEKARSTTATHVDLADAYARQGIILNAEVLKAKVFLAEMDELVARANSGVNLSQAALGFQMGEDQALTWELEQLPPPIVVRGALQTWLNASLEQRSDLSSARRKLKAGQLEEKVAQSGFLPEVAVIGRYDLYDDTIFGSNGHSGSIMAIASINLYRGGSDSAAREVAAATSLAFTHDISRFEEGVRLEVRQAWQELDTASARHAAALGAVDAANEALRVRDHRFKQGLDRMIDLLDAETAFREAELREMVARYDIAMATYRLRFTSGASLINVEGK